MTNLKKAVLNKEIYKFVSSFSDTVIYTEDIYNADTWGSYVCTVEEWNYGVRMFNGLSTLKNDMYLNWIKAVEDLDIQGFTRKEIGTLLLMYN